MEYRVTFGIDGGVSPGFGVKCPDYEEIKEPFTAEKVMDVIIAAVHRAFHFSREYLSNPETGFTTVTVLDIYDSEGKPVDQQRVLKTAGYDCIERFTWNDDKKLTIKCSQLEHLLLIGSDSSSDE